MIESTNGWTAENYDHVQSPFEAHTRIRWDWHNNGEFRVHVDWDVPSELILNDPDEFERQLWQKANQSKADWLMEQDALNG